jgi:hypothetical protein
MATALSLTSGIVTKEIIRSTCYDKIESQVPSSINWDNVIGQGTYGIILGTIVDPNWVVKVANKTQGCSVMDHEHTLHENANSVLRELKTHVSDIPIFCPETRKFAHFEGCCWYYMSKIWKSSKLPKLMHCLIFNDPDAKTQEKHSGIYPTPKHLSDHIKTLKTENKINEKINGIKDVAYLNGVIFGLLHYGSKQTAQDIEIALGKNDRSGVYNIFFYDFDKSEHFEEYTKPVIKSLGMSMSGPYSAFLGPLGERFKAGYRFSANMFAPQSSVCETVINNCEEMERMLLDDDEEGEYPDYDGGQSKNSIKKHKYKTHKRRNPRKFKPRKFKTRSTKRK